MRLPILGVDTSEETRGDIIDIIPSRASRETHGSQHALREAPFVPSQQIPYFGLHCFGSGDCLQSAGQVELFGGYSYVRASVRVNQLNCVSVCILVLPPLTQHTNLNGWNVSGQYKFLPFLGVVADFGGTYGTLDNVGTREHTFLFGPQISLPAKVSPFAHALFGVAKESQDPIPPPPGPCPLAPGPCSVFSSLGADRSFATAVGAGIDVKTIPFLSVRVVQIDYLRTQLHGATQNQPRVSAGVVFHF